MRKFMLGVVSLFALLCLSLALTSQAFADSHSQAFQLSLTPEVALHERDVLIEGVSLHVWGENPQKALSLGIISGSTGESAGFSWSLLANYADSYKGVHWAPVNYTQDRFLGWQSGMVNYAGQLRGLQTGFVNYAEAADGGLQLGLANVIHESEWFRELPNAPAPAFPFLNWRF